MKPIKVKKECKGYFSDLFFMMSKLCENTSKDIDKTEEEYVFENPKWGYDMELYGKKYRLVLRLEERFDEKK